VTRPPREDVRVVPKHHVLVRLSHWLNVPLLFAMIASGLAIYWASPVFFHGYDPVNRSRDYLVDLGAAIARVLGNGGRDPRAWVYDHLSLGTGQLAISLRWHWAFAYLFMLNGALYLIGLIRGGGWRALIPRRSDVRESLRGRGHEVEIVEDWSDLMGHAQLIRIDPDGLRGGSDPRADGAALGS